MTGQIPIGPGTRVELHFKLMLSDGELIDGTREKPASFLVGDGNLLPGFERAMFGLRAGDQETLNIPAASAFGDPNPENVHMMKKSLFDGELTLSPGLVVSFADPHGQERPGVIARILEDLVEVDFNHPLAGKDVQMEVEILAVEQVSADIIRM